MTNTNILQLPFALKLFLFLNICLLLLSGFLALITQQSSSNVGLNILVMAFAIGCLILACYLSTVIFNRLELNDRGFIFFKSLLGSQKILIDNIDKCNLIEERLPFNRPSGVKTVNIVLLTKDNKRISKIVPSIMSIYEIQGMLTRCLHREVAIKQKTFRII